MRALVVIALFVVPAFADEPREAPGETVVIQSHGPGYKAATPKKDPLIAPKYSDEAILSDVWVRAWLIIAIDDHGTVTHIKFLNHPKHGLEKIAMEKAFGTTFTPAHDGTGKNISSLQLYPIEWPSYWWLVEHYGVVTKIPAGGGAPCRGSGPLNLDVKHPVYRDCTDPDLSKMNIEPWIERPERR